MKQRTKHFLIAFLCLLSLLALSLSLVACGSIKKEKFTVTIAEYDSTKGMVTLSPESEDDKYEKDTEITVSVEAYEGFALDTFKINTEDRNASLNNEGKFIFKVKEDTVITVTFKATTPTTDKFTLTVPETVDNGKIEVSPAADTDGKYAKDTEITVTLKPDANYEVDTFTVGGNDRKADLQNNVYKFNITANTAITVSFKSTPPVVEKYSVTKNNPENGTIEIAPASADGKYDEGTEITVTLNPAEKYEVATFTVGGVDKKADLKNNVYKFTLSGNTAINATFSKIIEKYSLTKNTPENGTITVSPAAGTDGKYTENTEITVTLAPATGYEVDTFTVSGVDKKANLDNNVYKFNITGDTAINATFKAKQFTVTTDCEAEQGSITLSPELTEGKYAYGTQVTVTVTATADYELDTFTVSTDADAQLDSEGKYTLTVSADTTISATFKMKKYEVTKNTPENGEIEIAPTSADGKYDKNTEITVTLKPAQGYEVYTFTVGGVDKKADLQANVYKFNLTADTEINATFKFTVIPVTKISLSKEELNLETGRGDGGVAELTVTYEPKEATDKEFEWSVLPDGIVKVENGEVTPLNTGSAIITVSLKSNPEVNAECTVSVQAHEHNFTASYVSKDTSKHIASCECTATEEQDHIKVLAFDDGKAGAEGHYYKCSVCEWKEDEKTIHTLTPEETNSNIYHINKCTCGYSVQENHTYNAEGSQNIRDGVTFDDDEHFVQCYVCHKKMHEDKHTLVIDDLKNGTHKLTCSAIVPSAAIPCTYNKIVNCTGTELTYDDATDPNNHYTICVTCKGKFNAQPHKAEANGKCVCGKEMQTHIHKPIADVNGYYDGTCSCGDNVFFTTDGKGTITKFSADPQYSKIKLPTKIGEETITTFSAGISGIFYNNKNITDIIVPKGIALGSSSVFAGCTALQHAVILCSGNNGKIPANTFKDCSNLEWIVLSAEITELNVADFGTTPAVSKIKVYFMGTEDAWNTMVGKLKDPASGKTNAKTVFQSNESKILFLNDEDSAKAWHWETENVLPADGKKEL